MIDEKKLIEELEALKAKTIIFKSDLIFNDAINTVINKVNEQPKVNEWIPVEKKLPKEEKVITDSGIEFNSDVVLVTVKNNANNYYIFKDHTVDGKWNIEANSMTFKIIAWMPLPKPYGGKKNE